MLGPEVLGATLGYRRRCDLGAGAQDICAHLLGVRPDSPPLVAQTAGTQNVAAQVDVTEAPDDAAVPAVRARVS